MRLFFKSKKCTQGAKKNNYPRTGKAARVKRPGVPASFKTIASITIKI